MIDQAHFDAQMAEYAADQRFRTINLCIQVTFPKCFRFPARCVTSDSDYGSVRIQFGKKKNTESVNPFESVESTENKSVGRSTKDHQLPYQMIEKVSQIR